MHSVLIVEDDKDISELMEFYLSSQGFKVDVAGNGSEAIDYLKNSPKLPCLILLDLMMPGMSGWDFLKLLRNGEVEKEKAQELPVLLTTAVEGSELQKIQDSYQDIVKKPFQLERLVEKVKAFC